MPLRERKYAPAGCFYAEILIYAPGNKPPFREYALALKREKGDLPMGLRLRLGMTVYFCCVREILWYN